jgi:hypothetical protein
MRFLYWLTVDRHVTREEFDNGVAEGVVTVSRDHMGCASDIDVLAVRSKAKKLLCSRLA